MATRPDPRVLLRLLTLLRPYRWRLVLAALALLAADRLLVLEDGRLVAAGRHAELMQSSPLYRHLAELQFGRHPAAIASP